MVAELFLICVAFIMFLVARERLWLIGLRQAWNLSKPNAKRLSSRVVLFLSAPTESLKEQNMGFYFGDDAVRIWPATKSEALEKLVTERNAKAEKLEAAETAYIVKASKKSKKTAKAKTKIEELRRQIKEKNVDIQFLRENYELPDAHGAASVFVEFRTQAAAQQAYQQLSSTDIFALSPRFTGVVPGEVIWDNLTIPPASRVTKEYLAHAIVAATIIWWSIPTAIVGAISNVSYLAENVKGLAFLNDLPDTVIGLLTGLVPPLLVSLLSTYVPSIFRCESNILLIDGD